MLHRPASRDDLRAVVELFRADDVAYRGGVDTDDSDLTDDWDVPGFDFAASTLVVEDDGRVLGYGGGHGQPDRSAGALPSGRACGW